MYTSFGSTGAFDRSHLQSNQRRSTVSSTPGPSGSGSASGTRTPNYEATSSGANNGGAGPSYRSSSSSMTRRTTDPPAHSDYGLRTRSRSPGPISHKGQLKIHLQGFVVLVHPPESVLQVVDGLPGEEGSSGGVIQVQQPQDDTVLDGRLEIIMDKPRIAKSIRVEFVVVARLQIPGEAEWDEKELFVRTVEIGGSGSDRHSHGDAHGHGHGHGHGDDLEGGIRLEKGSQSFEFSIIVPATIATYDRHPCGRISQSIKATVEGMPFTHQEKHHSTFNIFSGISLGGKQKDRSRGESRGRTSSRPGSRAGSRAPSPTRAGSAHPPPPHGHGAGTHSQSRSRAGSRAPSPTRSSSILGSRQNSISNFLNELSGGDHHLSPHPPARSHSGSNSHSHLATSIATVSSNHHHPHTHGTRTPRSGSITPDQDHYRESPDFFHGSNSHHDHETDDMARPLPSAADIKALKGSLFAERHLIVAANPSSNHGEGLTSLNVQKQGRLQGVGEWKLGLTSDAFSVGSYLTQRLLFLSPSPFASIFAVRLLLNQSYSVANLDAFDSALSPQELAALKWTKCPKRSFIVSMDGTIPLEKRPGLDVPALWRGSLVGKKKKQVLKQEEIPFEEDFKMKTGRKRLPDDSKARPSTIEGTITPIKVVHELVMQVFFSVDGEDLTGNPIPTEDQSGVMRMLVLSMPVILPSCTCTFERVTLPEYSEKPEDTIPTQAGSCACGNTMEDFARREAARLDASQQDDVDHVDVDSLTLDGRGRTRGRDGRRKAEYDGSHTPSRERGA